MEALLDFLKNSRKLTKSYKNYIKLRSASIKLYLNCLKLCTMCFYWWLPHAKKNSAQNSKVEFFGTHTFCIGVVLRKSIVASVKVSSNHPKFCTVYFYDISETQFFFQPENQK